MLMPKKVKHRRVHRGRRTGKASGGQHVDFGDFALQALESCWMTNNQIEAARIAMTRKIKRGGKIWIRVFPDKPFTKKPAETRMGSGKGAPEGWMRKGGKEAGVLHGNHPQQLIGMAGVLNQTQEGQHPGADHERRPSACKYQPAFA